MKLYVEIILIMFLVILMYVKSPSLNLFARSILGKITLVITVLLITTQYGRNAGILSSVIFMLLLHTSYEGISKFPPPAPRDPAPKKDPVKKPVKKDSPIVQRIKPFQIHTATHHTTVSNARDGNNDGENSRDPPTAVIPGSQAFTNLTDLNRQIRIGSEYATQNATAE